MTPSETPAPGILVQLLRIAALLLLFSGATPEAAPAHPSVSVVVDRKGVIYYSDLDQVWRIDPGGGRSIAVPDVHTHELWLDSSGNLYGEHLWYEGEATDRWGHRVWRLSPDGRLTDVIPARAGFRPEYGDFSFVRDDRGTMYWVTQGDTASVMRRAPGGPPVPFARSVFRDVRWMTVTPGGIVYLVDLHDLVRVDTAGGITVVARDLAGWSLSRLTGPDRHAVMGLWTGGGSGVFVAVAADRVVKRIDPDGGVETVARSPFPWAPSGGAVAPDGSLLVLEYSVTNAVRVVRIDREGRRSILE